MSGNSARRRRQARKLATKKLNLILSDECGNGLYWCNHLYDEAEPWVWVDFSFSHSRTPKMKYFPVAATTLAYDMYTKLEDEADTIVNAKYNPNGGHWSDRSFPDITSGKVVALSDTTRAIISEIREVTNQLAMTTVMKMRPSIKTVDYGPGRVGVHCSLNTPYINDKVIRKFIEDFRSLGEPDPGFEWFGDEVEVEAKTLIDRTYANTII